MMKLIPKLAVITLFSVTASMASAETMQCGTHVIVDGQMQGQSRAEIKKHCGNPESSYGNNWYYKKGNDRYRLHFNDSNELESITLERAE